MSKIDELLKNEKVEWRKLESLLDYEQPSKYIVKSTEYDDRYKTPVLTAGQTFILGFTNEVENIYKADENNPVIIFDDFTAGNHWVDFDFKVKSSAMKMLKPKEGVNLKYCYHYIQTISIDTTEHKRLWISKFSQIVIPIPSIETQEKIVKTLDKFTNHVTELQAELQARTKQYEYYRDLLLSEDYLNKISEGIDGFEDKTYNVKFANLGEVAQVNRGASPRPISKYITNDVNGVSWIKIGDIGTNSKYVVKTAQKITVEGAKKSRVLKKGDFIISNSMSYGRPYILGIDGAIHDGWASISDFNDNLNSDFLYHFLNSSMVQNYWEGKINSSSVSNLNSEIIRSLPIPIVDKELQRKIAKILDKFQSLLSDTKGLLPQEIEQRQKQYEYYREKLLTFDIEGETISRQTDRQVISNDYFVVLKEAANIVGIKLFDVKREILGNCVLNIKKIKWNDSQESSFNYIDLSSVDRENHSIYNTDLVTMQNAPSRAQQIVHTEDVLFGTTRPLLQRYCIVPNQYDEQICSTGFCVLRANKEKILPKWILYGISTNLFLSHIEKYEKGTSYPAISDKDVKLYEIPLPSLPVQEYIVSILDKFDALINDVSKGIPKEIELRQKQYEYYREKLLDFKRSN